MPPLSQMVPVTSVDTIAAHALKMGWMEKVFPPPPPLTCRFVVGAFPRVWHFLVCGKHICISAVADCGLSDWPGIGGIVLWSILAQEIRRPHRFLPPKVGATLLDQVWGPTRFPGGHIVFMPLPSYQVSAHNRRTYLQDGMTARRIYSTMTRKM
jgi:hypothetical protein